MESNMVCASFVLTILSRRLMWLITEASPKLFQSRRCRRLASTTRLMNASWRLWEAIRRDVVPGGHFVVTLRESFARHLSHFNFLSRRRALRRQNKTLTLGEYLGKVPPLERNNMCHDLGLYTVKDLDDFFRNEVDTGKVHFVILERLPESLVVFKQDIAGWTLEDLLYLKNPFTACGGGVRKWDGELAPCSVVPPTEFEKKQIRTLNGLDLQLYARALSWLEGRLGQLQQKSLREDLDKFKAMQSQFSMSCQQNPVQEECIKRSMADTLSARGAGIRSQGYEDFINDGNGTLSRIVPMDELDAFTQQAVDHKLLRKVTLCVQTIERPEALTQLLQGVADRLHGMSILVADDSRTPYAEQVMAETLADRPGLKRSIILPFDTGTAASRNILADSVETEYMFLVDDDSDLSTVDLGQLVRFLDSDESTHIVVCSQMEMAAIIREQGTMTACRGETCSAAAAVTNFLARTRTMQRVRWNPLLKTKEHIEFFWRYRGLLKIGYAGLPPIPNLMTRNPAYLEFRVGRKPHFTKMQRLMLGIGDSFWSDACPEQFAKRCGAQDGSMMKVIEPVAKLHTQRSLIELLGEPHQLNVSACNDSSAIVVTAFFESLLFGHPTEPWEVQYARLLPQLATLSTSVCIVMFSDVTRFLEAGPLYAKTFVGVLTDPNAQKCDDPKAANVFLDKVMLAALVAAHVAVDVPVAWMDLNILESQDQSVTQLLAQTQELMLKAPSRPTCAHIWSSCDPFKKRPSSALMAMPAAEWAAFSSLFHHATGTGIHDVPCIQADYDAILAQMTHKDLCVQCLSFGVR